ncbi:hypothetical protein [Mycobacterium talmoniae]|uniref:Uncharacterized protein n=1 Tax=Mycobacterium talmoniae TaxID=1858794 RepID=A0A1S1NI37_9MYCO|nr:hypothetical protein [Mycobacterium talmoniae]OHV03537.1 hypothetical protein BKN37_14540 [Mycobacterium talmoniae]
MELVVSNTPASGDGDSLDVDQAATLILDIKRAAEAVRATADSMSDPAHRLADSLHLLAAEIECDVRKEIWLDLAGAQKIYACAAELAPRDDDDSPGILEHGLTLGEVPCFAVPSNEPISERVSALVRAADSIQQCSTMARFVLYSDTGQRRRAELAAVARQVREAAARSCR